MAQARRDIESPQVKGKPKARVVPFWHPESEHDYNPSRMIKGFKSAGCMDILQRGNQRAFTLVKAEFQQPVKNRQFIGSMKRAFDEVKYALQVDANTEMHEAIKEETIKNRFIEFAKHFNEAIEAITPSGMFTPHVAEHVGVAMAEDLFKYAKGKHAEMSAKAAGKLKKAI